MKSNEIVEYAAMISDIKNKIYQQQYETIKYVITQTINLYREIGEDIYN